MPLESFLREQTQTGEMDQRAVESRIMKKLTKLAVFSIWVLSFLFSSVLVTHTIDKNYVFLFCNGLLAFVVRHSGLINSKESSGKFHQNRASDESYYNDEFEQLEQTQGTASDNGEEPAKDIYVVQEDRNRGNGDGEEQRTGEEEEEDDDDCNDSCGGFGEEDEEEEDDGEETERAMKVEELNKKFDEFIRKMKEELRIEARRHLILV